MRSSEQTDQLAAALAAFQAEMPSVAKTHTAKVQTKSGADFSYSYADLADTVAAAAPKLSGHGLAVTQMPEREDGIDVLTTRVMHTSGQWVEGTMRLFLAKEDPQAHGSAITYARRYGYCAALGIVADEDDDGAAATNTTKPAARRQEQHSTVRPSPNTPTETGELASERQLGMISSLFKDKGFLDDRAVRHGYVKTVVNRDFASTKELTKREASKVIETLMAEPIQNVKP